MQDQDLKDFKYFPPKQKGIRVYDKSPVILTYQNNGSTWAGILRGSTRDIELVFNGLFNLGATNGELTFQDGTHTTATFWTNSEKLGNFFFMQAFLSRCKQGLDKGQTGGSAIPAEQIAEEKMLDLRANGHEVFFAFGLPFEAITHTVMEAEVA